MTQSSVKTNGIRTNHWTPNEVLDITNSSYRFALVILNRPIHLAATEMFALWDKAVLRITVDGGTDRWFSWRKENTGLTCECPKPPDLVSGDMDSISPVLLERLRTQEGPPEVIYTPDQNETDFTKSLRLLDSQLITKNLQVDGVVVLVETSGRLDQIMSNVNTLFKAMDIFGDTPVFQLASDSLSWLLAPGMHVIDIPQHLRDQRLWCSLVPIAGKCENTTTTGLKWNLENGALAFGEMVSTSNTYSGEAQVTIQNSNYILWSMGLQED